MIKNSDVKISIDVYIGDMLLEKKDFYTNYENIGKATRCSDINEKYSENVLDYLYDYKCLSLIDKNKFYQPICHWSLAEQRDYIFNLYDGFSGLYVYKYIDAKGKDAKGYYEIEHQYKNAPNTYSLTIPYSTLDINTIYYVHKTHISNIDNIIDEIDKNNKNILDSMNNNIQDMVTYKGNEIYKYADNTTKEFRLNSSYKNEWF
jgi:hypothetical protein